MKDCPPGSIPGFDLPLALTQAAASGRVDAHWAKPMLVAAARSPAVLQRLSDSLVSLDLAGVILPEADRVLPRLTRLTSLTYREPGDLDGRLLDAESNRIDLGRLPVSLARLDIEQSVLHWDAPGLARLTALTEFRCSNILVSQLPAGCTLPALRAVQGIYGNELGALRAIAPNLADLWVSGLGAAHLGDLASLGRSLTSLRLTRQHMWDKSAMDSADGLAGTIAGSLGGLRRLVIDPQLVSPSLGRMLAALPQLTWLEVADGQLDRSQLELLASALEGAPCRPDVSLRAAAPAALASRLSDWVVDLDLDLAEDQAELEPLGRLTRLTRLSLGGANSVAEAAAVSGPLAGLEHLELRRCGDGDGALDALGSLSSLTRLELNDVNLDRLSGDGLRALSGLHHLSAFVWGIGTRGQPEHLLSLPTTLTLLHVNGDLEAWMGPGRTQGPPLSATDAIRHLGGLRDLRLACTTTRLPAATIDSHPQLTSLVIANAEAPRLANLPVLRTLQMRNCRGLGSEGIWADIGGLSSLRSLRVLADPYEKAEAGPFLRHLGKLRLLEMISLMDLGSDQVKVADQLLASVQPLPHIAIARVNQIDLRLYKF